MPAWASGAWREGAWNGTAWAAVEQQAEQPSGGWENYKHIGRYRKTDDEIKQERIRLGIIHEVQTGIVKTDPVVEVWPEREWKLSPAEILRIRERVHNEIDLEIALHLHELENKRKQTMNLILILDAA